MRLGTLHTHNHFCDGEGAFQDFIDAAAKQRLDYIGFSGHAPLPFENTWTLSKEDLPQYLSQVKELKKSVAFPLEVYLGLEIDFIPSLMGPSDAQFQSLNLDYSIGSVHMLEGNSPEQFLSIDGPDSEFLSLLQTQFASSPQELVKAYYKNIRLLLQGHSFDILGHFDLIKKKNDRFHYLNEEAPYYQSEVYATLDQLKQHQAFLEVNTGGLARGATKELYPSPWILKEARKREIKIVLNSDAHHPKDIAFAYPYALECIISAGYNEIYTLKEQTWEKTPLPDFF